jgi:hypothetical protein
MRKGQRSAQVYAIGSCAILAACGGDGGPSPDSAGAAAGASARAAANGAPVISGKPTATAPSNTQYSFQPAASDPDGDVLTFRIKQRPAWATFSNATGQLQGTPTEADLGRYAHIVISVTDGAVETALDAFDITVAAVANGSATLTWLPPTENEDGTALTDLAGYKIYWGTEPDVYSGSLTIDNPGTSAYVVENLAPATYYFVATAFNAAGVESPASDIATGRVM